MTVYWLGEYDRPTTMPTACKYNALQPQLGLGFGQGWVEQFCNKDLVSTDTIPSFVKDHTILFWGEPKGHTGARRKGI